MGLADLFRPKHKHSDPEVRLEAVRRLGADDAEILAELARGDTDSNVRKAAIERLEDPVRLVKVATRELDSGLRRLAESRARVRLTAWAESEREDKALSAIARIAELDEGERALVEVARRAPLPEVRRAAVDHLRSDRALADVARSGVEQDLRIAALGRIGDLEILRAVAVDEARKEIGFAVVERLEDPDSLAHVASKGKNRSVRARASRKLASQKGGGGKSSEEKRAHAERAQLCRRAESLARTDRWEGSVEAMAEIRSAWEACDAAGLAAPADMAERFARATRRFDDRYEREGKAALAAAKVKAAEVAPPPTAEAPAPAEKPTPAARPPEPAETEDRADASEAAPEPAEDPARAKKQRAERETRAREAERALAEIVETLEGMSQSEEGGFSIKELDRALQRAQSRYRGLSDLPSHGEAAALADRYEEARRRLLIRVRELREAEEWKRWANVAKKEALIKRAEELLKAEEVELEQLKELQAEWKQAGPVPREKNDVLWSQFKATCDQIFERVKVKRAAQFEVEKQNLEQKEALLRRAEELAESTDWERTAEEIKKLQREWKEIGPVPKRKAGPLWKRFRAACDRFFERRKPHLEKRIAELQGNLEAKQKVCTELEALAEQGDDWDAIEEKVKSLRSDYRKIGPVPRGEMDAIGARFRAACDRVAERRREAMAARVEGLRATLDEATARIEARLGGEDAGEGEVIADVMAARAALRELERESSSEDGAAARGRLDELVRRAMEALPDAFRGTDLDPEAIAKKKRKLCERAEELLPEEPEAPGADASPEQMAAALKAALADRALGVHRAGQRPIAESVADLREQWARLGPIPGDEAVALEDRFAAACERALNAAEDIADPPADKVG